VPRRCLTQVSTKSGQGQAIIRCELRYQGAWGVEAQILRDGELVIGRRFDTKSLAVQWAEQEQQHC
jgi:hypothetical protein